MDKLFSLFVRKIKAEDEVKLLTRALFANIRLGRKVLTDSESSYPSNYMCFQHFHLISKVKISVGTVGRGIGIG